MLKNIHCLKRSKFDFFFSFVNVKSLETQTSFDFELKKNI